MRNNFLLLLLYLNSIGCIAQTWENTYTPGTTDKNGKFYAGTEIMQIVAHKGKLYAGNSYWFESDTINNPTSCEIVRLDSPSSQWLVDCDNMSTNKIRISTMRSVIFTTDMDGNNITPDTILIAVPNDQKGKSSVYIRDDINNTWIIDDFPDSQSGISACRDIGFYKDPANNISYVFVGIKNYGIFKGSYNASVPGKIQWEPKAEFVTPKGERTMGFAVCNGELYAASSVELQNAGHIYKRINSTKTWTLKKSTFCLDRTQDIRGFTAIPNPNGAGQVLWYTWDNRARILDPSNNYTEKTEFSFIPSLTKTLGVNVSIVVAAPNAALDKTIDSSSGDTIYFVGLGVKFNVAVPSLANESGWCTNGMYYERHQNGANVFYSLKYIINNSPVFIDDLIGVRSMVVSPFPEDSGKVIYAGGYECIKKYVTRTAWIYRGDFRDSVPPAINNNQ